MTDKGLVIVPTKKEEALYNALHNQYELWLTKLKEREEQTGFHEYDYDDLYYNQIESIEFGGDTWANAMYKAGYSVQYCSEVERLSTPRAIKLMDQVIAYWWDRFITTMRTEQGFQAVREFNECKRAFNKA